MSLVNQGFGPQAVRELQGGVALPPSAGMTSLVDSNFPSTAEER